MLEDAKTGAVRFHGYVDREIFSYKYAFFVHEGVGKLPEADVTALAERIKKAVPKGVWTVFDATKGNGYFNTMRVVSKNKVRYFSIPLRRG